MGFSPSREGTGSRGLVISQRRRKVMCISSLLLRNYNNEIGNDTGILLENV